VAKHAKVQQDEKIITPESVITKALDDTAWPATEVVVVPANDGVPTQVANPSRASWRTFVQALIPFIIAVNIALPLIQSFLVENIDQAQAVLGPVYGWAVIGVNVAVIVFSLGSKLIALLMAQPRINELIKKYLSFLAPIPQKALTD
jgi:hypothetical protein